jgi:hypothetical protein
MARIDFVPDAELSWWVRLLKRVVARRLRLNQDSKSFNFLAHNQKVLFANSAYMATLDRWKRLPTRLKRLVHLRVAMKVGCPA